MANFNDSYNFLSLFLRPLGRWYLIRFYNILILTYVYIEEFSIWELSYLTYSHTRWGKSCPR